MTFSQQYSDLLDASKGSIPIASNPPALMFTSTMSGLVLEDARSNDSWNSSDVFQSAIEYPQSELEQPQKAAMEQSLDPYFTDGQSRIVLTHDGVKDCHAFLLTKEMLELMKEVLTRRRRAEKLEGKIHAIRSAEMEAEGKIENLELDIAGLRSSQQSVSRGPADDQESRQVLISSFSKQLDDAREAVQQAVRQKADLEDSRNEELRWVRFANGQLSDIYEQVLCDAKLLKVEEINPVSEGREGCGQAPDKSNESNLSSSTFLSMEALNRKATRQELFRAKQYVQSLQEHFDNRRQRYNNELADYLRAVEDGTCRLPLSDFDRIQLENEQRLTGCLIQAEAVHQQIFARAVALQVPTIGSQMNYRDGIFLGYEESEVHMEGGGYRESSESESMAGVHRDWIQSWTQDVADSEPDAVGEDLELREWEQELFVEISDSISMVAEGRDRNLIDEWISKNNSGRSSDGEGSCEGLAEIVVRS
ncbi:MAG: hypothetical protein M1812_003965 [Candelaria pacifica]|nr:MAG: hypothetical protein M1812_003965 [Candelaria pacifica]